MNRNIAHHTPPPYQKEIRLRKQGGSIACTIPSDFLNTLKWENKNSLFIEVHGKTLVITERARRKPRGQKSLDLLLKNIDSNEIKGLNESIAIEAELGVVGAEC